MYQLNDRRYRTNVTIICSIPLVCIPGILSTSRSSFLKGYSCSSQHCIQVESSTKVFQGALLLEFLFVLLIFWKGGVRVPCECAPESDERACISIFSQFKQECC